MNDVKRVWDYFAPVFKKTKKYGILSVVMFGLWIIVFSALIPLLYKQVIDVASRQVGTGLYELHQFIPIIIIIVFSYFIGHVFSRIGSYSMSYFRSKMTFAMNKKSARSILDHDQNFFANNFVGTLTNKVSRLSSNYSGLFESISFGFFLLFVDIVISVAILTYQNIYLGLLFFVFMTFFVLFSFTFTKKQAVLDKERSRIGSQTKGRLSDIISNVFNISIFSNNPYEKKLFDKQLSDYNDVSLSSWNFQNKVRVYKSIFFFLFDSAAIILSLYLFTQELISLGTLVLVQTFIVNIGRSVWNLDKTITGFIETYSDTLDAIDVVTAKVGIVDVKNPELLSMNNGLIKLSNIDFTYKDGDHVFDNFNLQINPGQSIGIVGKSGSGKTTLTKLLLRFYDIDGGNITIDNQNIAMVKQDDLRSRIAYIPQETILFHRTVFENIAYGNPDASYEEVMQAARSAHVDEFVQNLQEGYETKVGERGVKLSGGQRQRIGIARAMLKKDAPILVLDEATSSLDSMSEQYIQESFEKLSENRTTIVIAHRLSTIQKMDRIIVMDNGQIIEDGPHAELLSQKGHYAELWHSQVNGFIPDN